MPPNPRPCLRCGYPSVAGGLCDACPPGTPPTRPAGFGEGFTAAGRGLRFLLSTPRTKRYAAIPVAFTLAVFAAASVVLWRATESLRTFPAGIAWLPAWAQAVLTFLLGAAVVAAFLVLVWLLASTLTAAVAAPFLDLVVGRIDEVRFGRARSAGGTWLADASFTVVQALLTLAFLLPLNAAAFVVAWIPPLGPAASFFLLSTAAGFGAFDFAAGRRRWTFGQKLRVTAANFPAILGLGLGIVLLTLVPCVGWMFAIPAAAAGGGLLLYRLDLTRAAAGNT